MTLGAITAHSRSGGSPPMARSTASGRGLDHAVAEVRRPVGLAGLAPALGASLLGVVHDGQGDEPTASPLAYAVGFARDLRRAQRPRPRACRHPDGYPTIHALRGSDPARI